MSHRWAKSLRTLNSRGLNGRSSRPTAFWLLAAAITAAACGSSSSPGPATASGPGPSLAGATAIPSSGHTKSLPPLTSLTLAGRIGELPVIAIYTANETPKWAIGTMGPTGWLPIGDLPNGSTPVTDGITVANVPDPETGPDLALVGGSFAGSEVNLPKLAWVQPWRGIYGVVPLVGRSGYMLIGAGAIAIIDDLGAVNATPTPDGFVALAPTSDANRYLLASIADASEAGALSESTPFAVYLWTIGSKEKPSIVQQHVVATAPSTIGLAWLRTDDGSWWSVSSDGTVASSGQPNPQRSLISPDGRHLVRFGDSVMGCPIDGPSPCPVSLIAGDGSTQVFDGPASGVDLGVADIGMVLSARPALRLPWRLVFGPVDQPATTSLE